MTYARFVAVDWSGARGPGYRGVAVAECHAGDAPPRLVAPPDGRRWRRSDVLAWMLDRVAADVPTLFGFDFAFALPFCDAGAYLPGTSLAVETPQELWRMVDSLCAADADLAAHSLLDATGVAGQFWAKGKRPAGFNERLRVSDKACRSAGLGRPQSVFKLIGAAQVGKGSLAGMRLLNALQAKAGTRVAVWPFDSVGVPHRCCEIYPGLFAAVGGARGKLRDVEMLAAVLRKLGCAAVDGVSAAADDHDADALVSAAGLRYYAGQPATWRPSNMTAAAREGWIVGLP